MEACDQVAVAIACVCIQESQSKKDTCSVQGESCWYIHHLTHHVVVHPNLSCAGDSLFRDWLVHMGFRAVNEYTLEDKDCPNMEPGHSQRSLKWWQLEGCLHHQAWNQSLKSLQVH
jgi:hypothetical protein